MDADRPWPLRFELLSANALVWIASVGRDGDLTPDAHRFFFDRYERLAEVHRQRGHTAAAERLQAKADAHWQGSGSDGPPYAAAMAMPRPHRWMSVNAVAREGRGPADAA